MHQLSGHLNLRHLKSRLLNSGHLNSGHLNSGHIPKTYMVEIQTSANNSTWYRLPIHQLFVYGPIKMIPNYWIFAWLEYLYFRQIIWLFVKANRINSNYSCFWAFVVQSWIIISSPPGNARHVSVTIKIITGLAVMLVF